MIGSRSEITFLVVTVFIPVLNLMTSESCSVFKTMDPVSIDTKFCLFQNFTEPVSKWICIEFCYNNTSCSGVVTARHSQIYWCCVVLDSEVRHRKPGDMVLYYKSDTPVKCQNGWAGINCDYCAQRRTGENCDSCATGWAGQNCKACATGWAGRNCDMCEFGFSTESNCTKCIHNGLWTGNDGGVVIHLTFDGPACNTLLPGTVVDYNAYIANGIFTGGDYDNITGILTITDDAGPHYMRGFNPHGDVLLDNKMIIGAFTGPNSAGAAIDLFFQG